MKRPDDQFRRWEVDPGDLDRLSPPRVRDLYIDCFLRAQKEMFSRVQGKLTAATLTAAPTDDELADTVREAVVLAFEEAGESFDEPTKAGLRRVLDVLALKASGWGTPKDIVSYHRQQLLALLDRLR